MTTNATQDQSAAFRSALFSRHPACVISENPLSRLLTASRLMPKRLGDVAIQSIFTDFTGLSTLVARFHEFMGITLTKNLNALVDDYQLGFWHKGGDYYEMHVFFDQVDGAPQMSFADTIPLSRREPLLFHHVISIHSQSKLANPPPGVFAWHYIQRVLMKFATDEYKNLANINHFNLPFRTEDDDDDPEFDDPRNIEETPLILRICWILLGRGDVRRRKRQNNVKTSKNGDLLSCSHFVCTWL